MFQCMYLYTQGFKCTYSYYRGHTFQGTWKFRPECSRNLDCLRVAKMFRKDSTIACLYPHPELSERQITRFVVRVSGTIKRCPLAYKRDLTVLSDERVCVCLYILIAFESLIIHSIKKISDGKQTVSGILLKYLRNLR